MMNDILPTLERTFRGHSGDVVASSFHPNLQQMASGSVDNNVMLWSFKTSMRALRYVGHTDVVHGVSFSPDGRLVASCSADTTIRLWIPTVKGLCTTLKAHASTVRAVQFSNDNRTLISASDDKSVKLWSVSAQKFLRTYSGHNNWVRSVVMSPDGRVIASGGDDRQLLLFDTNSKSIVHSFHENTEAIRCVQFSPDGTCVAAAGVDGCIKVWDLRTLSLLEHYDAHEDIVTGISYHAGGNWMISSSLDGTTKVWDVKEGFLYFTMESHAGAVHSANFSPCGSMFATTGADTSIMVWSANFARSISSSTSTNKSRTDICAQRDQELSSNTKVAVRTPDVTRKRIESRHVDPRNNFLSTVPNHQFVTVHEDALGSRQRSATQPTLSGTGESNENKILRNPRVCPPVPLVSESCETIETRVSNAQHKSNSHSISTGAEKRRESRTGSDNDAMNFTLVETIQSLICQLELMRGTQELMETRIGTLENALRESFSRSVEREVSLIERVDDLTLQMEALKRKHESE